ncbi:MAG TPA: sigma-54 dependent transcriptional regulator [Edaphobacter sp.]|jgi:two-component system response regulator HydG
MPDIESNTAAGMHTNVATYHSRDEYIDRTVIRVLVVDDDNNIRTVCRQILFRNGAEVVCASTLADAEAELRNNTFDLLLLDMKLPDGSGISLLKYVKAHHSDMAVVVMTAFATISSAVEAMRIGASDYITKPFAMEELITILQRAGQRAKFSYERSILRAKLRSQSADNELIGRSAEMERLHRLLAKVTFSTHPVLILGEHGTGKEVLAKSIHFNGPNASQPFVVVNCNSNTIDQDLFGNESSSSDLNSMDGVLASTEGGTVCLDEISELSLDLQSKLLRTLQEKIVRPRRAGSAKPLSTRILASSSEDLSSKVEQGKFRRDLFFRLNVMTLKIPALRLRREDISLLAMHFLAVRDKRDGTERRLSDEVFQLLDKYDWPGNVRELENTIVQASALSEGPLINVSDLPPHLREYELALLTREDEQNIPSPAVNDVQAIVSERKSIIPIAEMEKQAILDTIDQLGGDKVMAAKLLGIGKTTLYRKLKEYGVIDVETAAAAIA